MKLVNDKYVMTRFYREEHMLYAAKLTSTVFANGGYLDEIQQGYFSNCHYDYASTRLIWDGDQVIHHWGVWGYEMRVSEICLRAAGIGAVGTDERYRGQGLMTAAAYASFDAMRENGYDLSILRGKHYVRFGYARAWNYVYYKLTNEQLPSIDTKPAYIELTEEHLPALGELYNTAYAGLSGTAVRPTYRTLTREHNGLYGWQNDAGELVGYIRAIDVEESDEKSLLCLEAAGDPAYALAVLADLFDPEKYEYLRLFTFHRDHGLPKLVRQRECLVEDRYFHNTGWRVKVINLFSALLKLLPELEKRVAQSVYREIKGSIEFEVHDEKVTLILADGTIAVEQGHTNRIPLLLSLEDEFVIARLVIGSDEPAEIFQQAGLELTEEGLHLLNTLFPNLHPMLSHWDEY